MHGQVIIVEGIHDEAKIKEVYPDANCVITNGSEISDDTLNLIKKLSEQNEIIIFTDPDAPGERIRKRIMDVVPSATHAFLKKAKCISKNKKKVGIEHAAKEDIEESLHSLLRVKTEQAILTMNDLIDLNLAGSSSASLRRDLLSARLNIGKPNAKTFLKRLMMFGISYKQLEEMAGELDEKNWK